METVLEMARRHVREGEARVVDQRDRIAELHADGRDTRTARALLVTFETTLAMMVDHLRIEEAQAAGL